MTPNSWTPSPRLQSLAASWSELTAEEIAELESILRDPQACRWYRDFCLLQVELRFLTVADRADAGAREAVRQQVDAPHSLPIASILGDSIHNVAAYFSHAIPFSWLVVAMLTGIVVSVVALKAPPAAVRSVAQRQTSPVGRISDLLGCEWARDAIPAHENDDVAPGREFKLESGLLEITYESGAKVVLQGPVTYQVESATGGYLSVGKLTGRVLTTEARGFSVRTPTAVVVDLGTEFGVEVSESKVTWASVFRGAVEVQPIAHDGHHEKAVRLIQNESLQVNENGGGKGLAVCRVIATPHVFVRDIRVSSVVDMLDIVAGGDGSRQRRGYGIDVSTGTQESTWWWCAVTQPRPDDGRYHRIAWHNLIDGVFVPSGVHGPVVLDSSGHTYDLPTTTGGVGEPIWVRPAFFTPEEAARNNNSIPFKNNFYYQLGSGNRKYMPDNRGLLAIHANAGITFDLAAIRTRHSGRAPARFRAVAGNGNQGHADVWVFVDGRLAFACKQISNGNTVDVDVALKPSDHFLTLVSTEGDDGVMSDWVFFGDPVLEFAATAVAAAPRNPNDTE